MFKLTTSGDFRNLERFLDKAKSVEFKGILDKFGARGVSALASATPVSSGKTASSWDYTIEKTSSGYELSWTNSNKNQGVNIAVILQYGHGTGTGGYVTGRDYINPALRPIFDQIANEAWKAISNV